MPTGKSYSSKANEDKIKAAVKSGKISEKQMKALPEGLLLGIVKRAEGGVKKKRKTKKGSKVTIEE